MSDTPKTPASLDEVIREIRALDSRLGYVMRAQAATIVERFAAAHIKTPCVSCSDAAQCAAYARGMQAAQRAAAATFIEERQKWMRLHSTAVSQLRDAQYFIITLGVSGADEILSYTGGSVADVIGIAQPIPPFTEPDFDDSRYPDSLDDPLECQICNGTGQGYIPEGRCDACGGSGITED